VFRAAPGDAAACDRDRELHGTGHRHGRLDADVDRTALGKFGGVVEEQSQDLFDLLRVALRLRMQVRIHGHVQFQAVRAGFGGLGVHGFFALRAERAQ